ncbi:hypothetical protein [Niveispirillum irakense]|nr:hypothetical protein [Niveispirillum irakense]
MQTAPLAALLNGISEKHLDRLAAAIMAERGVVLVSWPLISTRN